MAAVDDAAGAVPNENAPAEEVAGAVVVLAAPAPKENNPPDEDVTDVFADAAVVVDAVKEKEGGATDDVSDLLSLGLDPKLKLVAEAADVVVEDVELDTGNTVDVEDVTGAVPN